MNSRNMFSNTNSSPRWRETVFRTVSGPTDTRNQAKQVHNLLTMAEIRPDDLIKAICRWIGPSPEQLFVQDAAPEHLRTWDAPEHKPSRVRWLERL